MVTDYVINKAEDMFRLAQLHLDELAKCKTKKSLYSTVHVLPTTLYETYTRAIERIPLEHMQDVGRQCRAQAG